MPGIVGIFSPAPAELCQASLQQMLATLVQENACVSGNVCVPNLGIYAGWVGHPGSCAARNSGWAQEGDLALAFSGEDFSETATTRGLLDGYRENGEALIPQLNGLFSALIVDIRRNEALLFNDRYGLERLYVHERGDQVYFASEAKALLAVLPEVRAFDPDGVTDFMTFGCTVENRTLFRHVRLLPGATSWKFTRAGVTKTRYFDQKIWEQQPGLSAEEFEEQFESTLKQVLPRYCEPAANVGISLTAGLDTRMIMACLPPLDPKPVCYTYEGPTGATLDTRLAARVAHASGLSHHVLRLEPDFFSNFDTWVNQTVHASDGCFGVLGAHESYLTEKARQLAPVRLTGVFGSEIFRGASTFKPLRLDLRVFSPAGQRAIAAREAEFSSLAEHPVSFTAFREVPWSLFGSLAVCRARMAFRSPYLDNQLVALSFRAPHELRKSSRPAWRLIHKNAPRLAAVPTDMGVGGAVAFRAVRGLFAKITFKLDYLSNEGLPHWAGRLDPAVDRMRARNLIFGHHKFLRYGSWFRNALGEYIREALSTIGTAGSEFLDLEFVSGMATRHTEGRGSYFSEIDRVLTLDAVDRLLLKPANAPAPQFAPRFL